ncbi:hypothetical protein [Dethiothermospora halolimnae]|uniref:hypothetical protein n=1 Tax=Dethiothermospora halolimnae TaxID=3114390 RepID=UPI003CCB9867
MKENLTLRAFSFIDNMQPQYAALTGTVVKGDVALAGMAQLYIELKPGSHILTILDAALKRSNVKPGFQFVEREFGMIEVHSTDVASVKDAGNVILNMCGLTVEDRVKPIIVSEQIIHNIDPYQAQLINRFRNGSLLIPGESVFSMEVEPAAYITKAVNEAEKHEDIKVVDFEPLGKYGRLYISGREAEIIAAREAAIKAMEDMK